MGSTRISTKGQVVLPKEVREALHWECGQELEVISLADGVLLKPAGEQRANWNAALGSLKKYAKDKPASDAEMHAAVRQRAAQRHQGKAST